MRGETYPPNSRCYGATKSISKQVRESDLRVSHGHRETLDPLLRIRGVLPRIAASLSMVWIRIRIQELSGSGSTHVNLGKKKLRLKSSSAANIF